MGSGRRNPLFRGIGYAFFGLAVLGFSARVVHQVIFGDPSATYVSGRGIVWPFAAAFVTVVAMGLVLLVGGIHRLWLLYQDRRVPRRARRD